MGVTSTISLDDEENKNILLNLTNLKDTIFEPVNQPQFSQVIPTNDNFRPQKKLLKQIASKITIYPNKQYPFIKFPDIYPLEISIDDNEILNQIIIVLEEHFKLQKYLLFSTKPSLQKLQFSYEKHREISQQILLDLGVL